MEGFDIKYYKGTIEGSEGMTRAFFAVADVPRKNLMDEDVQVVAKTFEGKGNRQYASIEECEKEGCCLSREISREEYELYFAITRLTNEIYMNQYTGGFPRNGTAERILRQISKYARMCMSRMGGQHEGR